MKHSIRVAVALAGLTLTASVAGAANLIKNGDFANVGNVWKENVGYGADDIQSPGATDIPSWINVTPPGAPAKYANEAWIEPGNGYGLTASHDNGSGYFVDLTGQNNEKPYGGLSQTIATTPGMGYTLTFALGSSTAYNSSGLGASALTASAKGTSVLASHLFSSTPTSSNGWVTETLLFIADSDSTTIELLADSSNTSQYVGLDDVAVEARVLSTTTDLKASTTSATSGSPVSLTAQVKPSSGTATPTGKVEFKSGTTVLGTVTLNGAAQAVLTTSSLTVGKDSVTAAYLSDDIYGASTSTAVVVTITAGSSAVKLSATSLAFGDEASGSTSVAKTITVANSGTSTLSIKSIALTGSQSDDFALSNKCGTTLAANASCTFAVTFKPVAVGAKSASVSLSDSAGTQTVTLTGTGTAASGTGSVKLSPTSLAFGDETSGSTSAEKTVTLTNSGTGTLSLKSIALSGSQSDDFALSNKCGTTLAANASCTFSVTFKPVAVGAKSASVSIADSAGTQTVSLTGTGTAASGTGSVKLSATSLAFGSEAVGKTSAAKTLTITNSGTATLSISSIDLSGSQDDDFGLTKSCGATLAAGKSCTASVTFKPVAAGAKSASIKIADSASGSPQTVSLTGTGS